MKHAVRRELTETIGMVKPPLVFTFYIAAPIEKVWDGFVSKEANQTIFMARISRSISGPAVR